MDVIKKYQSLFEKFAKNQHLEKEPANLYKPVSYIMGNGGKRLRPVLVLIGHHLFDPSYQNSLPIAYAVELFHNFSLVHDDIMDEAPVRRNLPTVHAKYGINAGILSGDLMLILVYRYLSQINHPEKINKILSIFNTAATQVCEGQQMDMDFEKTNNVSIDQYLKMIEYKTAVLLAASLGMGAIMAGTDENNFNHIYEFGRCAGIAFQLQDDILDTFGDPEKFGKKVGGDIAQNKKTFLILKALEAGDVSTQQQLKKYLADPSAPESEKISAVTNILETLNIREIAEAEKQTFHDKALNHLNQIDANAQPKVALENLASQLLSRET